VSLVGTTHQAAVMDEKYENPLKLPKQMRLFISLSR